LESICRGFNITLSQFFAEGKMVELMPDLKAAVVTTVNASNHDKGCLFV